MRRLPSYAALVENTGAIAPSHTGVQGRCDHCRIRYIWERRLCPLRFAHCPKCCTRLRQTVYYVRLPLEVLEEGERPIQSRELPTCAVAECSLKATGEIYSAGAHIGDFCDSHGRRMMALGRGDEAHSLAERIREEAGK